MIAGHLVYCEIDHSHRKIKILNFHINRDIDGLFRLGLISPCSSTFQNRERSYENHINHERLYGRYLVNS
ncbi:hypothetical protein L2E82_22805 [Cichorium intybus]|uniref:Uncharacterized protein n=1 Tax=Cichorium intybus TaxID=13427 RepID=A0ACB9DYJ4_CICIN|nr:hypothetical protein L2E82_22805 [Cichorium intybus]